MRKEKDKKLPVKEEEFYPFLLEWTKEDDVGERARDRKQAGFVDDKLLYMEFRANVNVSSRGSTSEKEPYYD